MQIGGIAALDNMEPVMDIVKYYLENARLVREALDECGIKYVGGVGVGGWGAGVGEGVWVCGWVGVGVGVCMITSIHIYSGTTGALTRPTRSCTSLGVTLGTSSMKSLANARYVYCLHPSSTSSSRPHTLAPQGLMH